jgi:hypothetical protein
MSIKKLHSLQGKTVQGIEEILDAKGRATGQVFMIFEGNYKLKVKVQ